MKKIFQYIGILALTGFSFYYAEKVAHFLNKDDTVMKSINEYAQKYDKECDEGYITDEGVVLGIGGLVVDTELSYFEMKGVGFDSSLIEYKENPCIVSKINNRDNYIIKGNSSKKAVSLIININSGKNLSKIIEITKTKNINVSLLMNNAFLENNKDYIKELINNNYDILYKGNTEEELKSFLSNINMIKDNKEVFCVYQDNDEMLKYCYKNNINTIKTKRIYSSNYLSNVKNKLEKGDFIILEESSNLTTELGVIINYIKSRGLKVITITKHLSN